MCVCHAMECSGGLSCTQQFPGHVFSFNSWFNYFMLLSLGPQLCTNFSDDRPVNLIIYIFSPKCVSFLMMDLAVVNDALSKLIVSVNFLLKW